MGKMEVKELTEMIKSIAKQDKSRVIKIALDDVYNNCEWCEWSPWSALYCEECRGKNWELSKDKAGDIISLLREVL